MYSHNTNHKVVILKMCEILEMFVGCRHIYMQRQPLVDLFDNIYYNRTVYTDVLEGSNGVG
jgi:hypothetical protein